MVSGLKMTSTALREIPFLVELRKAYYMKSILLVTPNKPRCQLLPKCSRAAKYDFSHRCS